MPADPDRQSTEDSLKENEAGLAAFRKAAIKLRDAKPSRLERTFLSKRRITAQREFAGTMEKAVAELRKTIETETGRIGKLERELNELQSLTDGFRELRNRLAHNETELMQLREKIEHGEAAYAGFEKALRQEMDQLGSGQAALRDELRERLQQLLDEQRVCIRQLSLRTSEDAVLADRARRALELRLEEIESRLPGKTE
jgi:chromosome segregation ATPase